MKTLIKMFKDWKIRKEMKKIYKSTYDNTEVIYFQGEREI